MFKSFYPKKMIIIIAHKIMILIHILRSIKNYLKIFINKNINNYYLPNLVIKNVVMIDPMKIKYITSVPMKFNKSSKFIINFDWGVKNKLLLEHEQKHHTYVSCRELFVKGVKIEKCKEYYFFRQQIIKNNKFKNCRNDNDIILYLKNCFKLFESIKKNGLKQNINNNIEFMIDENYNLVKINSGNHRFSISRILKLKKIPVEIKIIHMKCFDKKISEKIQISRIIEIIKNVEIRYS